MKSDLYFKHDLYALDDMKLRRLVSSHHSVGYAVFFETVAKLMKEESHSYPLDYLTVDLSFCLHEEESTIAEVLKTAIENCDLFYMDNGNVKSHRVDKTCEEHDSFSRQQSEKAKKRWGKNDATALPKDATASKNNATASKNDATASKTDAVAMPINQEQEQYQEQEKDNKEKGNITNVIFPKKKDENEDSDSVSEESEFTLLNEEEEKVDTVKDNTPYKEITDYWNQGAEKVGYPQIAKLTNGRKVQIKCRWDEFGRDVFKAMDNVFKSEFLKKWGKCTIDWMMSPTKMLRAIEGMYSNDEDGESDSSTPKKMYKDYSHITDEDLEEKFSWEK